MKIAYTFVISDLFHYGHLQLLEAAHKLSDKLICGVLTDEAVKSTGGSPISNYEERSEVIRAIRFVSEVMPQSSQDPFENLSLLRAQFPHDEIIFVYGENWGEAPGGSSLNNINITLKKQSFYKKLSTNHIACKFVEKYYPNLGSLDTFTERFVIEDFDKFNREKPKFTVTTKANTLQKLKPLLHKSTIERTYVFTVADWQNYQEEVLQDISEKFDKGNIVIRSSCLNEDTLLASKAGHYQSVLNVSPQDRTVVLQAITQVIDSYSAAGELNLSDQVLIQHYTEDLMLSGVAFTKDLATNAPYYLINYDVGNQTDTVTSGKDAHLLKIFKHIHRRTLEAHWQNLLAAIDEIEHIIPKLPLDIEFAIKNNGQVVIFQVRPLAANMTKEEVCADEVEQILKTQIDRYQQMLLAQTVPVKDVPFILSDMAFWNPSELIGCQPSILASDLFQTLFMYDGWYLGIAPLHYNNLSTTHLMVQFCNKPYINVNMAFWATIPQAIPAAYHFPLYQFYLNKLQANPHLHDKVEFNILFTCYDFDIRIRLTELKSAGFSEADILQIETALIGFTKDLIHQSPDYFTVINQKIAALDEVYFNFEQKNQAVEHLLNSCKELGTIPFSTAARMAFIAEALLKSMVSRDVLSLNELQILKKSFTTVAYQLTEAIADVADGRMTKQDFMGIYGHLRAGTYDISQKRYDQNEAMVFESHHQEKVIVPETLASKLDTFLSGSPLNISFTTFYQFAKTAIELRERSKFVFTKVLSDILEILKAKGANFSLMPEDLAYLKFDEILKLNKKETIINIIDQRKSTLNLNKKLPLPALIIKQDDFMRVGSFIARPNFVTDLSVEGRIVVYNKDIQPHALQDKIVFIENADPGFHWILSYRIKGLVTKFGGVASHMAICCAELGIPAAIGCGNIYDALLDATTIKLDCVNQILERTHA